LTKIRWSDKVRLGRLAALGILEAKDFGERHLLEKYEGIIDFISSSSSSSFQN